jgi:hypothetical protein
MALDINKNTPGNYRLYVKGNDEMVDNYFYSHNPWANPTQILFAGNGLVQGKMHANVLSKNDIDIDSYLRGIRANDLVNRPFTVVPELVPPTTLNVTSKLPQILPQPLVVSRENRPMYLS